MPLPVATRTRDLKRGAMARTPETGVPRVQRVVGGLAIMREVQSPALETRMENPGPGPGTGIGIGVVSVVVRVPGSEKEGAGMAANACHSTRGRSVMRMPREAQGRGVWKVKWRRTA